MSVQITIDRDISEFLVSIQSDLNLAIEDALDQSAAAILHRLQVTYLAEQDPYGVAWVPSKAAIKRRSKNGTGTLFDTGTLYRSIQLLDEDTPGVRVISTDVSYGKYHQWGEGDMHREFLSLTPEHEEIAYSIFENALNDLMKEVS